MQVKGIRYAAEAGESCSQGECFAVSTSCWLTHSIPCDPHMTIAKFCKVLGCKVLGREAVFAVVFLRQLSTCLGITLGSNA